MSQPQPPDPKARRAPLAAVMASERRGHTRRPYPREVILVLADGSGRPATVVDLARDGLSLQTDRPLAPGSRGHLSLPLETPQGDLPVDVQFKSVYSSYSAPGRFRVGLVFLNPDAQRDERIHELLAR